MKLLPEDRIPKLDPKSTDHVLAVLSPLLCLNANFANTEAKKLTDRSVSNHMRLLTDYDKATRSFHTYSPSEPVLALAASDLLCHPSDPSRLGVVLDTLSEKLCQSGLIERGLVGELAARILLLVTRIASAPDDKYGQLDFLEPVLLLTFVNTLFGSKDWANEAEYRQFQDAFGESYINFTHWIITKDALQTYADPCVISPVCSSCLLLLISICIYSVNC